MTNVEQPLLTTQAVREVRDACGIDKANCHTCLNGSVDTDGEHGQHYCGMVCGKRSGDDMDTYLEDQGVDLDSEKACWLPEFWMTNFADDIDGSEDSLGKAFAKYRKFLTERGLWTTPIL